MKRVMLAAAALMSIWSFAAAQSGLNWASPDRVVRLQAPADWIVIVDQNRATDYPFIVASPTMAARRDECSVLLIPSPRGPLPHNQQMLNDARAGLTAEGMFASQDEVHSFRNEILRGVRVVSYDVQRDGARLMERLFQISRGDRRTEYVLSCTVVADAAADIEASRAWLDSLEIRR